MTKQVLLALNVLRENRIVHRDIHPRNIMCDKSFKYQFALNLFRWITIKNHRLRSRSKEKNRHSKNSQHWRKTRLCLSRNDENPTLQRTDRHVLLRTNNIWMSVLTPPVLRRDNTRSSTKHLKPENRTNRKRKTKQIRRDPGLHVLMFIERPKWEDNM